VRQLAYETYSIGDEEGQVADYHFSYSRIGVAKSLFSDNYFDLLSRFIQGRFPTVVKPTSAALTSFPLFFPLGNHLLINFFS
jgi:hypothetical protein